MLNGKTFLAIIPARGGSKRLPRKNVLDLAGMPLIGWSIKAARESKYLDEVVVSTDDEEIASISANYGVNNIIERPVELASDTATSLEVVKHVVISLQKKYDYLVLLQPTSPLRKSHHIDESIELMIKKEANAVISVCETNQSPLWCNTLSEDGNMDGFFSDEINDKRSQDLPKYYKLNGAIYCVDISLIMRSSSIFSLPKTFAFVMESSSSIDIDTAFDFFLAKQLLEIFSGIPE